MKRENKIRIIEQAFDVLEQETPYKREIYIELLTKRRQPVYADQVKEIPGVKSLDQVRNESVLNRIYDFVMNQLTGLGYDWDSLERDLTVRKFSTEEMMEKRKVLMENYERNAAGRESKWDDSAYMTYGT